MADLDKTKILFVCLGNICRSPAAEGIFKQIVDQHDDSDHYMIDSAGTGGYHIGDLPDKRMRLHASQRGYILDSRSRKIELEDFLIFDYIITMDDSNYNNVLRLAPDLEARDKVHKMMEYSSSKEYDHIPDPYYEGADGFELVLDLLEEACNKLYLQTKSDNKDKP